MLSTQKRRCREMGTVGKQRGQIFFSLLFICFKWKRKPQSSQNGGNEELAVTVEGEFGSFGGFLVVLFVFFGLTIKSLLNRVFLFQNLGGNGPIGGLCVFCRILSHFTQRSFELLPSVLGSRLPLVCRWKQRVPPNLVILGDSLTSC